MTDFFSPLSQVEYRSSHLVIGKVFRANRESQWSHHLDAHKHEDSQAHDNKYACGNNSEKVKRMGNTNGDDEGYPNNVQSIAAGIKEEFSWIIFFHARPRREQPGT